MVVSSGYNAFPIFEVSKDPNIFVSEELWCSRYLLISLDFPAKEIRGLIKLNNSIFEISFSQKMYIRNCVSNQVGTYMVLLVFR